MKYTTVVESKIITFDLEYKGLLFNDASDNFILYGSGAAGGTSMSTVCNLFDSLLVRTVTKRILRTKVKKGCNKGKTRVTVCTLK